jgi:hypothetical protein
MKHEDYVNSLITADNRTELQLKAARATQEFDAHIALIIDERGIEVDTLSDVTGVPVDRLNDLLDGDSPLLEEVLLICHALELDVLMDSSFRVRSSQRVEAGSHEIAYHPDPDTERSEVISPV